MIMLITQYCQRSKQPNSGGYEKTSSQCQTVSEIVNAIGKQI